MLKATNIIIAAKCAPEEILLQNIKKAGLAGVELYFSEKILNDLDNAIQLCKKFPFRYAVHAPNDSFSPVKLAKLVAAISAEVVIFHNIFWEDEWEDIINAFNNTDARLCVENTSTVHEPLKFIRRYGLGRCLDLEHLQLESAGVYEEEFIHAIGQAAHIHLTGYVYGSQLWHTHIYRSPKHSLYLLDLIKETGYSGMVVSEAKESLQTYEEFKKLNRFYQKWKN